jgi:hypothetical protein
MTLKRGLIYGLILSCLGALWFLRRHDANKDQTITSQTLAPHEQEKIVLDPVRHTVTTVTRTGPVKQTFLPPHPVSVSIDDKGVVTVTSRAYGTELSPFVGLAYSDTARLALGVDLLYWHRWEVGPALLLRVSGGPSTVRVAVKVSYNVWSNTSLFVGVDNRGTPTGGISWKF